MIVHYRVNGKERKRLAEVIAKEIGVDAIYQGAPTFSYQMDYFTVDREGALVFDDENYSDEVYGGMAFMKAQWITHNLAYELATGSDETKQIIAALAGEPAKKVARRAKELDLTPVEAMSIQERTLTERIRQLFVIPATHDTETQPD